MVASKGDKSKFYLNCCKPGCSVADSVHRVSLHTESLEKRDKWVYQLNEAKALTDKLTNAKNVELLCEMQVQLMNKEKTLIKALG